MISHENPTPIESPSTLPNGNTNEIDTECKEGENALSIKHKRRLPKRKKRKMPDYDALAECRKMFRLEMLQLGRELNEFRNMCNTEILKYKRLLREQKHQITEDRSRDSEQNKNANKDQNSTDEKTAVETYWQTKLDSLQSDMSFLEKKQEQLDKEQQLLDKEEELSERQQDLEKYEKEIAEIESVLDRRQARCVKRETDLLSLEEDLQKFKQDLEESKSKLEKQDEESAPDRAKRNWEVLRKSLQDKETVLECTVKKYRAELAASTSNLTAKNIMIDKLDEQIKNLYLELDNKNRKIQQLESRLVLSIQTLQRQNSEAKPQTSPFKKQPSQSSLESASDTSPTHDIRKKKLGSSLKLGGKYDSLQKIDSQKVLTPNYENGGRTETGSTNVVRHPFRQSIDCGDGTRFLGLRSPLPQEDDKSASCAVM